MRLIDIEQTLKNLEAMKRVYDAIALDGMIKALEEAPTIDAVPVVRCKDCRWYATGKNIIPYCWRTDDSVEEADYCSKAERGKL